MNLLYVGVWGILDTADQRSFQRLALLDELLDTFRARFGHVRQSLRIAGLTR
jgi:hypothetical protein